MTGMEILVAFREAFRRVFRLIQNPTFPWFGCRHAQLEFPFCTHEAPLPRRWRAFSRREGAHNCLDCVGRAGGPPHRRIFFQPTSQSAVAFRGIPALWRGRAVDPMRPAVRGYRPVELSRSSEGGSMILLQYPGGARNERGPAHPGSIRSKANRVLCGKLICCSLR